MKNSNTIIIKETDKGSGVVVWDREDYLKEAKNKLDDKDVNKELTGNVEGPLQKTTKMILQKVRNRRDISDSTLDYFLVNSPKLGIFPTQDLYEASKYARATRYIWFRILYRNISAFFEFHLKPQTQKTNSYIKASNDVLWKIAILLFPTLPDDIILCTIDVVGLHPNIPHDEGLIALKNSLESREDKTLTTDLMMDLAECVLKNNNLSITCLFLKD